MACGRRRQALEQPGLLAAGNSRSNREPVRCQSRAGVLAKTKQSTAAVAARLRLPGPANLASRQLPSQRRQPVWPRPRPVSERSEELVSTPCQFSWLKASLNIKIILKLVA